MDKNEFNEPRGYVPARVVGCDARKSTRRTCLIDGIMDGLTSDSVYGIIGTGRNEAVVAHSLHASILEALKRVHCSLDPSASQERIAKRAADCLLWEGNINTTINHIQFLGAQHRPDFIVQMDGIRVAVEVKRGESGAAVREALGQCLVYASQFEFTCCVLVDTSLDKKLKRACVSGAAEQVMLKRLWDDFNIRLAVV